MQPVQPVANAGPAHPRARGGRAAASTASPIVWVVSDERVERRAVTLGPESEGTIEIRAGVNSGDELVSPVVQGLDDGGKVKLKEDSNS